MDMNSQELKNLRREALKNFVQECIFYQDDDIDAVISGIRVYHNTTYDTIDNVYQKLGEILGTENNVEIGNFFKKVKSIYHEIFNF